MHGRRFFAFVTSFKGHCHEHRSKNSRFQKHILQQRKTTNTGPVLIKITMPVLWSWKRVLSLWYHQELKIRTWKRQPDFFKFCHRDVSLPSIQRMWRRFRWCVDPFWTFIKFILQQLDYSLSIFIGSSLIQASPSLTITQYTSRAHHLIAK